MRTVGLALVCLTLLAQTPDLKFIGNRFRPLKYAELTPAQKTMADNLLNGERAGATGPFNVLMRSPEIGDAAQKLGAQVRFHSSLPPKLNEFAIIITGRYWTSQYEWYAHKSLALRAGLKPEIVAALADGKRPGGMDADEEAVYSFATETLNDKHVSDKTFQTVVAKFGERGAVDLTAVVGYYQLVCSILNLDGYPLPTGAQPELKPLR
jgi:4-carboxymuconolactone decarboxylase